MKKALFLSAMIALLVTTEALAGVDFFPIENLTVGKKGVGKTVIRGTEVETFNVEIIDILPTGGFDGGPLILARFSGPVIEQSGGIAAGYSGSPVYIDGKLLGAVSSAVPFSDLRIGGITPISTMVRALPRRGRVDYSGNTVVPEPKVSRKPDFLLSGTAEVDMVKAQRSIASSPKQGELAVKPLATPLIASGVSPRSMKLLRDAFRDNPFVEVVSSTAGYAPSAGGLLYDAGKEARLQPGDAIAISLAQGDIELSAIGTVTYVDDMGQVLAFGHPFLLSGDTSMPMGKAYIAYTHKSIMIPFKDGFRINNVGAVTSDRLTAVGGYLGESADIIPISVKVNDIDTRKSKEFKVEVIRLPEFFDLLVSFAASEAFVRVVDMEKGGTVRLEFSINGVGLKEPITRVNYFYDEFFPISALWEEALPLASLLANNIYREVKITEFNVKIDFTRNRVNASIDDAKLITEESKTAEAGVEKAPSEADTTPETEEETPSDEGEDEDGETSESQTEGDIGVPLQMPGQALPVAGEDGAEAGYEYPEPPKTVYQGQTLEIEVRLQPFRQDPVFKRVFVTIPEDFPTGMTNITVRGGGSLISLVTEVGGRGKVLFGGGMFAGVDADIHDLDKIIEKALSTPPNNEVVVSIFKPIQPPQPDVSKQTEKQDKNEKEEREFKVTFPTEWVIYNQSVIPINIQPKVNNTSQQAQAQG